MKQTFTPLLVALSLVARLAAAPAFAAEEKREAPQIDASTGKRLNEAIEFVNAEKYAEAARLFAALEAKYPKASEVFFYGGVSRLHQQEHREGLRLLEQARRLDEPDFADEVSFYLALAQQRTGNSAGARAEFEKLCAAKQESSARACDAAQALNANTAR